MRKNPAAVLVSGGLDSAALLVWALERHAPVHPVYVRFGLGWEKAELAALRRQWTALRRPGLRPLTVLEAPAAPLYGDHWSLSKGPVPGYRSADASVYLPGRNLLLLGLAGVYCARQKIPVAYFGALKGNPFADSRPPFLRAISRAVSLALGAPFRAVAPFRGWSKIQVLSRFPGARYDLAFSCLNPRGLRPCGACNKCAEGDKARRFLAASRAARGSTRKSNVIK
ncbi:MAG: 7-cyano-7-deazaguanine synthase [Elusimicrobia bacterium]|nr:7-cyano-7-deazaguanine synthase [Elusimicrobiota bacterium]